MTHCLQSHLPHHLFPPPTCTITTDFRTPITMAWPSFHLMDSPWSPLAPLQFPLRKPLFTPSRRMPLPLLIRAVKLLRTELPSCTLNMHLCSCLHSNISILLCLLNLSTRSPRRTLPPTSTPRQDSPWWVPLQPAPLQKASNISCISSRLHRPMCTTLRPPCTPCLSTMIPPTILTR
uniref:Uncharacterized protein n=1 Tax=Cacopsylla melanoneura TaxID=428564 RepID=A0A8D8ZK11_9HEMI